MMDDRELDDLLHTALRRAGEPAPFPVDVADRVMRGIAAMGPVHRTAVPRHQFVRWGVAAVLAGVVLMVVGAGKGLTYDALVHGVGMALAGMTTAVAKLSGPGHAVAGAFVRIVSALASSIQAMVQPLAPFQPLVRLLLVAMTAGMLATTTYIVGRDVRSRAMELEQ